MAISSNLSLLMMTHLRPEVGLDPGGVLQVPGHDRQVSVPSLITCDEVGVQVAPTAVFALNLEAVEPLVWQRFQRPKARMKPRLSSSVANLTLSA